MRKTLFSLVLLAGMTSSALAVRAPLDSRGHTLPTIDFVGADTCLITSAAPTGNGTICSSGTAIVYGVVASSITPTNFLVFRDTNVSTGLTVSTTVIVFAQGSESNVVSGTVSGGTTQIFKFPVPIKFNNGINIVPSGAPVGQAASWTIIYRKRNVDPTVSE